MSAQLEFREGRTMYIAPKDGSRQSYEGIQRRNGERMYVSGKYIPKTHKLYKPGVYSTFEEAWSHVELDKVLEGQVYLVQNPAWPEWVKVGMAVDAEDRLRSFNTSSPYRDYELVYSLSVRNKRKTESSVLRLCSMLCSERRGEWFNMPVDRAVEVFEQLKPLVSID
jgi:hypothetical protein